MFGNYTTAKPELSENLLLTRARSSHLFILFQQNVQPPLPVSPLPTPLRVRTCNNAKVEKLSLLYGSAAVKL